MVLLCSSRSEGQPIVEADANYVVNTQRGTNLEKLGLKFKPEHVLAALIGCDLDNVIIELNARTLLLWMVHPNILLKLLKSWKSKKKMPKEYLCGERSYFTDEVSGSEILVMPNDH
jgi:UDP-3-O-[3-hydroxymyristoyl] N-acetylglucosamine deacetylase/3-hydroxyacyl-[acyl-carrier-protein] dehydratase